MTVIAEKVEETAEKALEKMKMTATWILYYARAARGLPPEDENQQVLIHGDDIRERTRVTEKTMKARVYMNIVAKRYPYEFSIFKDIVDDMDHYSVSLNEGEGRREFILAQRSKGEIMVPGAPMQLPSVQTQQTLTEQPKDGKKK